METDKRTIHRYSPRSSWIQDKDQENLDVAESWKLIEEWGKAKTDDEPGEYHGYRRNTKKSVWRSLEENKEKHQKR
jgi:hypothetical protein